MNKNEVQTVDGKLLSDVRHIIDTARANAVRSVDFNRAMMYWNLSRRIFEEEHQGKDKADYGTCLTRNLAITPEPEYESGFGVRQLEFNRRFYRAYPIVNAPYSQLNWSQYRLLISMEDAQESAQERVYCQHEAVSALEVMISPEEVSALEDPYISHVKTGEM